jgi:hypothetical protein
MDAGRLHTRAWLDAVDSVRKRLELPEAPEAELENWVHRVGARQILSTTWQQFRCIHGTRGGVPLRYFRYFLSCALTHHRGTALQHSLPDILKGTDPPLRACDDPCDYYTVWYSPIRQSVAKSIWTEVLPPAAFEIRWPKSDWEPRTRNDPTEEQNRDWDERFDRVRKRLHHVIAQRPEREGRVALNHVFIPGFRYVSVTGELRDLPIAQFRALKYRGADGSMEERPFDNAGERWSVRTGHEHLLAAPLEAKEWASAGKVQLASHQGPGLQVPKPGGPVWPAWTPILIPSFADYLLGIEIRGGAALGNTVEPYVPFEVGVDGNDREMGEVCEAIIKEAWGTEYEGGSGRPRAFVPVPGASYDSRVKELYRQILSECRDAPSPQSMAKLRRRAERQAQREFQGRSHAPLARNWNVEVEQERPWRSKHRS